MMPEKQGRLLYVWDADYPWDVRTAKVCGTLAANGWDVHIAARNRAWCNTTEQLPEGTVHRMPPWRALGRRLDAIGGFPAFFNPRWVALLQRVTRTVRPDLILVRDLPLAPTALFVGRRHALPVVLDMAENYPAMAHDIWLSRRQRPWDVIVRNPRLVAAVERWVLPRVDHTLVVVEESGERLRTQYGIDADRLTVVSNTPPRTRVKQPHRTHVASDRPLQLVYLGLMEIPRGVGELIEAQAILRQRGVSAKLRLIGGGRDLELFRRQADRLGLGPDLVEFMGVLPNAHALDTVADADIGVVPHHANESWNTTVPNKLFDYMAAGLAVITSDAVPCTRIVSETNAGVVFASGDPHDLARAVLTLLDPMRRNACALAGQRAIESRFNWEHETLALQRALATVRTGVPQPIGIGAGQLA